MSNSAFLDKCRMKFVDQEKLMELTVKHFQEHIFHLVQGFFLKTPL